MRNDPARATLEPVNRTLRAAVIGLGSMGANHARVLADTPGVELVAVADPDAERVRKAIQGRPIPGFASPAALLAETPGAVILDFKHYFKNVPAYALLLRRLRKRGWVTAIYHIDAPWNNGLQPWRYALIKALFWPVDIFFTHAITADAPSRSRVVYLPNACGLELCDTTGAVPDFDVGFCGNFSEKNVEHRKRIRLLEELKTRFAVAGISFRIQQDNGRMETWIEHARRCRLQLSVGSAADRPDWMSPGLPARMYGLAAIGCLTLIEPRAHLGDDFPPPHDLPTYEGPDDCVQKAREILRDPVGLINRRKKLMAFARARHLYKNRLETVVQTMGQHLE